MNVSVQEAAQSLARLLDAALGGEDVIIGKGGMAVRLVPVELRDESIVSDPPFPSVEEIMRNRTKLHGTTVAELLAESRRDLL